MKNEQLNTAELAEVNGGWKVRGPGKLILSGPKRPRPTVTSHEEI